MSSTIPPIVFKDAPGHAGGIAIDVLEHVAHREQWRVEYVFAPWAELLHRLETRELDLVVGIGSNETRRHRFRFTLGAWVLEAACTQTHELRTRFPVRVAVNVSVRQLESRKFIRTVIGTLERSGLPPDALELEVTESVLLTTSRDVGAVLKTLKDVGVRFAIDDFGIGYSSLSYLTRLPIDTLKIDRTFVAGLPDATRQRQIVATILAMGRGLGLTVVAEGIETPAQLQALREQGCPHGQGYLIGRPLPLPRIEAWLREPSLSG